CQSRIMAAATRTPSDASAEQSLPPLLPTYSSPAPITTKAEPLLPPLRDPEGVVHAVLKLVEQPPDVEQVLEEHQPAQRRRVRSRPLAGGGGARHLGDFLDLASRRPEQRRQDRARSIAGQRPVGSNQPEGVELPPRRLGRERVHLVEPPHDTGARQPFLDP